MLPKILVILGPTASGKSDLAVQIAKKFNGEIISADSRQVYKGLDIGTGKITLPEMSKIPHHLLDVVSPKKQFSAAEYKKLAEEKTLEILSRNKLPIIVGGTGFYISALLGEIDLPEVPPDLSLRKKLEKKSKEELFKILKKLDPKRAENIDSQNPRRLIRAIEISKSSHSAKASRDNTLKYNVLKIGVKIGDDKLRERINRRLKERMKKGMVGEAKRLHNPPAGGGLSYKRMRELGLEYKLLSEYLKKEVSKEEMIERMQAEIWQYAKRQMTWFKRDKTIVWLEPKIKIIEKEIARLGYTGRA